MYDVKKSLTKGKCRNCDKKAADTSLFKITTTKGKKKESYYVCQDCCLKTMKAVFEKVDQMQREQVKEWVKGTIYESSYN